MKDVNNTISLEKFEKAMKRLDATGGISVRKTSECEEKIVYIVEFTRTRKN